MLRSVHALVNDQVRRVQGCRCCWAGVQVGQVGQAAWVARGARMGSFGFGRVCALRRVLFWLSVRRSGSAAS